MKVSSTPMSAWNLSGENIQVATPMASVRPVNSTPLPVIVNVSRNESTSTVPVLRIVIMRPQM